IPPQTSTIASHLPRAVGLAFAIGHAKKLGVEVETPDDAVVVCSFGDASLNHSTAQGALNAAAHASHRHVRLPLLFVCEDNGLGISVPSPAGWVEASLSTRPSIRYFAADGCDAVEALPVATEAVDYVRRRRRPAALHLSVVRLLGHAGSDVELAYRRMDDIRAADARDPLRLTARRLAERGVPLETMRSRYEAARAHVAERMERARRSPGLRDAADVMAPLSPRTPERVATEARRAPDFELRRRFWGDKLPESEGPMTLAESIRHTLGELLLKQPGMIVFGEDVGRKGGVYGVTRGLQKRASPARVFDTLLDEQTILGLALGCAQHGLLPFPEIQYLAYLHNAEDQLRGEAATLPFFSDGQWTNPMVLRIAGLGYQKGFGGHFHNDNSLAVLRDIPGLVLAIPSNGLDAAKMLRECVRLAREEQRVVVFLEPIALYPMRDLHEAGDGGWMCRYPDPSERIALGEVGQHGEGRDLAIVTFGNGTYLSTKAAQQLESDGISTRVIDLRWISPLPEEALRAIAASTAAMHRVAEIRRTRVSGRMDNHERHVGEDWIVSVQGKSFAVVVAADREGATVRFEDGDTLRVASDWTPGDQLARLDVNGEPLVLKVGKISGGFRIRTRGADLKVHVRTPRQAELAALMPEKLPPDTSKLLLCPMPGLIVKVNVAPGDEVQEGQALCTVEAMKMENILRAERKGVVAKVNAGPGDSLAVDDVIMEFE
ncbi:MAG TPA: hypothetical protein DEF51_21210, partial [Myxococcales bacterium]|nr:hypothetical protein [Myxococcales bacterium]